MGRNTAGGKVTTPGQSLREILTERGISQAELARRTKMSRSRIRRILQGGRVTASTALRLAAVLGIAAEYWLTAQMAVDLQVARRAEREVLASLEPGATSQG